MSDDSAANWLSGTVIAAAIAFGASILVAIIETRRRKWEYRMKRRDERQDTYQKVLDLLSDWSWRADGDGSFDVVRDFSMPFVRVANRVRVYGSPACVAALDEIQRAFARLNRAKNESEQEAAQSAIFAGLDRFVTAARADVGPKRDDNLEDVPYRQGAGPRA